MQFLASTLFAALLLATASASPIHSTISHFIAKIHKQGLTPNILGQVDNPNSISSPIGYTYGSPVLTGNVKVYLIYYGTWSSSQKTLVEAFISGIGSTKWWNIERKYYFQATASSPKIHVNGVVTLGGTSTDAYSLGTSLSGNALPNIIQSQIDSSKLPEDNTGVYFVLTSADVAETIRSDLGSASFCKDYCGYHVSWQLTSGKRIYYAMAGAPPSSCINGCAPPGNYVVSPNGDVSVDAMTSVIAHELAEAVSDPYSDGIRAWQDNQGNENADMCAYTYGATSKDSNGALYNLQFGGHHWMIQQNWDPVLQACA
eukprot:jgi/Hompol1/339/HPOL_001132-RA